MPVFDIFASPRWSPLRMRTKVVSFFIFFQELSNKKKIKALRPKMTKIASRGVLASRWQLKGKPDVTRRSRCTGDKNRCEGENQEFEKTGADVKKRWGENEWRWQTISTWEESPRHYGLNYGSIFVIQCLGERLSHARKSSRHITFFLNIPIQLPIRKPCTQCNKFLTTSPCNPQNHQIARKIREHTHWLPQVKFKTTLPEWSFIAIGTRHVTSVHSLVLDMWQAYIHWY